MIPLMNKENSKHSFGELDGLKEKRRVLGD
jgi:hypothetical protein